MKSFVRALAGAGTFGRVARGLSWLLRIPSAAFCSKSSIDPPPVPRCFGLMALVQVFVTGLVMFSDVGLGQSVMQNKRGDEDDFLNTA